MKKNFAVFSLFWLTILSSAYAFAQQPTATLTGTVIDQQGAVIPNATVTATNKNTDLSRTVTTNNEGLYIIPNLPVGVYQVKISSTNFKDTVYENLELKVGQIVASDATLNAGGQVNVVVLDDGSAANLVDTETSKVDAVINAKEIENLPLNGAKFSRTRVAYAGKYARAEFRSDENEHGRHFVSRADRSRRKRDDRRNGQ